MEESVITIDGQTLTTGQAMAVRLAVSNFWTEMENDPLALGDDEHGRRMVEGYRARLTEVMALLLRGSE